MATETIGLRIQLNGMNTVIQDVETLERLLKEANQDLKQIPIGSENYKILSQEIANTEKQLGRLTNVGKQSRKELEDSRRGAEMLNKAFVGAASAIALFGSEGEKASELQKVAMQGVTVVAAAQTIAQFQLGEATVATTIAMRAEAAAAATTNTALKGLFTTMAANPVSVILVAMGLLVGAFYALTSGIDEADDSMKNFNETVNTEASKSIVKLQTLTTTINNNALSLDTRTKAVDELRKMFPDYFKGLTDEQILTRDLKKDYDALTRALENKAIAQAAEAELVEIFKKQRQIRKDLSAAIAEQERAEKSLKDAQQPGAIITGGGSVAGMGGGAVNIAALEGAASRASTKVAELTTELNKSNSTLNTLRKEYTDATVAQEGFTSGTVDNTDQTKKNEEAQKKLIEKLNQRAEAQLENLKLYLQIGKIEGQTDAKIIKDAEALLEKAKSLLEERNKFFKTAGQEFSEEIGKLLFENIPSPQEIGNLADAYYRVFSTVGDRIVSGQQKLFTDSGEAILFTIEDLKNMTIKAFDNTEYLDKLTKNLPVEQASLIKSVFQNELKNTQDLLSKLKPEQEKLLLQYFNFLSDSAKRFSTARQIGEATLLPAKPSEVQAKLVQFLKEYEAILNNASFTTAVRAEEIQKSITNIFDLPRKELKDFKTQGEFDAYNEAIKYTKDQLIAFASEASKVRLESADVARQVIDITTKINNAIREQGNLGEAQMFMNLGASPEELTAYRLSVEQIGEITDLLVSKIKATPQALEFLFKDISLNINNYLLRFGKEGLQTLFNGIVEGFGDISKKSREELEDLLVYLNNSIGTIKTELGAEAAKPFEEFAKRVKAALESLPTEADKQFQKTIEAIGKGLQQLQQMLGQIGNVLGQSFALELEKLEYNYQNSMNGIVGDTKLANDKRVELEKAYQQEKKRIEKQARLTSLRISLAEAIAGGAQGVVAALAVPPPAGPILAGINAGIAALQVGVIAQQIDFVASMRRGGKLQSGGVVNGPSHEYGGVRFMNGGVELEGNEAIINRMSTIKYSALLDNINQQGGGRPILVGNAMDSRLVEVIAKQRQEPIRAYVLEQDITKSQTINRRLEQLASF